MYLLFFIIWVILNGRFNLEIAVFGLVIAGVIYAFMCKFMDFSVKKDMILAREFPLFIQYVFILIWEIIKANIDVLKIVFSSKYDFDPEVIKFKTHLKTKTARVILANSITLTPGTITVSLIEDEYVVHCLDKDFGEGIDTSIFVKKLEKMEALLEKKEKTISRRGEKHE